MNAALRDWLRYRLARFLPRPRLSPAAEQAIREAARAFVEDDRGCDEVVRRIHNRAMTQGRGPTWPP